MRKISFRRIVYVRIGYFIQSRQKLNRIAENNFINQETIIAMN